MGACGCASFPPDFKLEGPDGVWYTISIYAGCADCSMPAGVLVGRLAGDSVGDWDIPGCEPFPFGDQLDPNDQERLVPIIDKEKLQEHLMKSCGTATVSLDGETYDEKDLIADMIENERPVEDAIQATIKEWNDERKASHD